MILEVNLVKTVPSAKFISGQIVTCALTKLIVPLFSLLLCLVIPSILCHPKRDLYEYFFYELTM